MGVRFTRTARYDGSKSHEAWDFCVRMRDHFKEHYGLDVVWGYQWGGPTGVIHWWVDYDSMGHWEEVSMSMVADETLNGLMAEGASIFVEGGNDTIVRLE